MRWWTHAALRQAVLVALASPWVAPGCAQGLPSLPEARLSPGAVLGERPRIGVNLGGRSVWGAEQLMHNVLRNPGLEAIHDGALVIASRVDGARVVDDSRWTARPSGFWTGARYEVLSGPAAGQQGRVLDNHRTDERAPDTFTLAPAPAGLRAGDVVALAGDQDPTPAPQWWAQGQLTAVPTPRPGSPGRRAVRLTATAGEPAALRHHLDSITDRAGKLLPVNGPWRLSLWVRAEQRAAQLRVAFGRHGRAAWLSQRIAAGTGWQRVELPFHAVDDGPAGALELSITLDEGVATLDDIELAPATAAPPGGFRAEVVQTLRALQPGYLREWQGQLADTPINRTAAPLARQPIRYRPGPAEVQFAYALPEFLALAASVGARPWVVLPATTTPEQARAWGGLLAEAVQRHGFDEIVVEHGNEHWNSVFRPAGMADLATLAEVADRVFAALRVGAGPGVPLHRVLGTQFVNGAAAGRLAALSPHTDGIVVAPYFHYRQDAGESTVAALDRALHEDLRPLADALAGARAEGKPVDVYEVNFHTTGGNASPNERAAVLASPAAGAALMRRLLQAMTAGVTRQAVYTLAGFDTHTSGSPRQLVPLFGITRDLATAANWRPAGAALTALNGVAGGVAQSAQCQGPGCSDITAMAFGGGTRWAVVSARPAPVQLRWACQGPQRLLWSSGEQHTAACEAGSATVRLPARSWLTVSTARSDG